MKKIVTLALSFLFLFSCINVSAESVLETECDENSSVFSSKIVDEMKTDFLELGVSPDKIDGLIEKMEKGELLDSMKIEYANITPSSVIMNDDYIEETYEYPDGSIKQTRISGGTFTGSISGGNYESASYYYVWTGAKVFATWGVVTASYYADFESTQYSSSINNVYNYGIITTGGTFSEASLTITNPSSTSSNPAQAQLFFIATATSDFGQATFYLTLYVPQGASAYAKFKVLN